MCYWGAQASTAASDVELGSLDEGWVPALHCLQPVELILELWQVWEEVALYDCFYGFCIYVLF
jgi:hypothetical protein